MVLHFLYTYVDYECIILLKLYVSMLSVCAIRVRG